METIRSKTGEDRDPSEVIDISKSVCPICLEVIDCNIASRGGKVYMQKHCDKHGVFEELVYSSVEDFLNAEKYNKPGSRPLHLQASVERGCPHDCGLCEAHKQHTCVGIIEVTDRCNLNCPVCFADSKSSFTIPLEKVKEMIDLYVRCEGKPEVLQISGGEPTLHPDILNILRYAGEKGIRYPVLNTNGIKLAERDFTEKVADTMQNNKYPISKPLIYLQFDGLDDEIYRILRGRPLLDTKMKALENCSDLGMNVALVPTMVKGINEHEMGDIIDFALSDKNIKMVSFQPATRAGRYGLEDNQERLTIPEVLEFIGKQTAGFLKKESFINIPCPYPICSVCSYIYRKGNRNIVLTKLLDSKRYMEYLVNRTVVDIEFTEKMKKELEAFESLLSMSSIPGSRKAGKAFCTLCQGMIPDIKDMVDNMTFISVHSFMDEYDFHLKRAMKCCVTEILPNGQMIPFCVYNTLYRKRLTKEFAKQFPDKKDDTGLAK